MESTDFAMGSNPPAVDFSDYSNKTLNQYPDLSLDGVRNALISWRPDLWDVTKVTLLCFTLFMSLVGNSIVISVSRRLFQQSSVFGAIIMSMSISHLLFGLTVPLHLGVVIIPHFLNMPELCVSYHASMTFFLTLTLVHLFYMAIDRLVVLKYPIRFHKLLKHWHMTILLTFGWIYAASSSGALLLWQLKWVPNDSCHPEIHFGLLYRILHLTEYGISVLFVMLVLIHVYFNSCKKQRLKKVMLYGRRKRKSADYSLRRNKLFSETGITIATLFYGICCPYIAINIVHIISDRTTMSSAVESVGMILILAHCFLNSLVLPWKIRSFRNRCVYCMCPCTEHKDNIDDDHSDDDHDNIKQVSVHPITSSNEGFLDQRLKNESSTDSVNNSMNCRKLPAIPIIMVTDFDGQKRLALRSDGQLDMVDNKDRENDFYNDKKKSSDEDDKYVWSTNGSLKPLNNGRNYMNTMYLLSPVDGEYPDFPREDEV